MPTEDDLKKLVEIDEAQPNDHVWRVSFSAMLVPSATANPEKQEEDIEWFGDYVIVAGGDDAEQAIKKAKQHILNPESFGVKIQNLRIDGVRLLTVVEVY